MAVQATKAIFVISRYQKQFGYFTHDNAFKLFDSMIVPILTYSAEIWGYEYSSQIEKAQTTYCKRLACLHAECGRRPLATTYITRCVKFWVKLVQMPRNRYPRQCYEMLRQLDEGGRNTWATNIKRLLYRYGFGIAWITQDIGNVNVFIAMFKDRLTESFNSSTMSDINTSPKALCYKLFKSALNPELYLSIALPYKFKRILANFKCSSHLLNIEQGRHLHIDRENRVCSSYLQRHVFVTENEIHFVIDCPLYESIRNAYLPDFVKPCDSELVFKLIMCHTQPEKVFMLS